MDKPNKPESDVRFFGQTTNSTIFQGLCIEVQICCPGAFESDRFLCVDRVESVKAIPGFVTGYRKPEGVLKQASISYD